MPDKNRKPEPQPRVADVRTMSLPVKLSEAEVSIRAQELAAAEAELTDAERRLEQHIQAAKGAKEAIQSEIGGFRGKVHRLAGVVGSKREDRQVPIVEEQDFEAGAVHTVRTDTAEIVATRGMTPEERQRSLFRDASRKHEA